MSDRKRNEGCSTTIERSEKSDGEVVAVESQVSGLSKPPEETRVASRSALRLTKRQRMLRPVSIFIAFAIALLGVNTASAGVVIQARSDGFPGSAQKRAAKISVSISDKSMRILNPMRYLALLINLEEEKFAECFARDRVYEEKSVNSFDDIQAKRQKAIREKVERAKTLSGDDRKKAFEALAREGIREDGKIVASSKIAKSKKEFEVRVNGIIRTYSCKCVEIRENKARDPIFRIWVTDEIPLKENILSFYRFGTFSKPVVEKLSTVKGFPIRIEAVLDNGDFRKQVFFQTDAIEDEVIPKWSFSVPPGFKKVQSLNSYFEKLEKDRMAKVVIRCAETGEVIKNPARAQRWRHPKTKKWLYFKDMKARLSYIRKLGKRK